MLENIQSAINGKFKTTRLTTDIANILIRQKQNFGGNRLQLGYTKWQELQVGKIFSSLEEAYFEEIRAGMNKQANIIKQIIHVKFTNLKVLFLRGNCITTIQILQKLQATYLQRLSLGGNNLTSIKSLRKMNLYLLTCLQIDNNYLTQLDIFSQLNCRKLDNFWVQFGYSDTPQCENIDWIMKIQSAKLKLFRLQSKGRIKNMKKMLIFKKKQSFL